MTAATLSVDLAYQDFTSELAALPRIYGDVQSGAWVAYVNPRACGSVALRPSGQDGAELKRLYVAPTARGLGLGRKLLHRALDTAIQMGCKFVRLDTLAEMQMAPSFYVREGFERIDPYHITPVSGTTFIQCDLTAWSTRSIAALQPLPMRVGE